MRRPQPAWVLAAVALVQGASAGAPSEAPGRSEAFEQQARPVLAQHCLRCHNATRARADLDLSRPETALRGGRSGPALLPGHSAQSLLYQVLQAGHAPHMPPKAQLTPAEVAAIAAWIDGMTAAAAGPRPPAVSDEDRRFWSFVPPRRPPVPQVRDRAWVRTPVDAFVLAALEARGLSPAPPAGPRTLLRRATLDLTGLPPTPEEARAFAADPSPDAYERLIERLLASPAYGERWGRHWLDLARYADSGGFNNDPDRPHAWRYRDYVLRAFNADLPYDRFVTEQLAGDELAPEDAEALTATGFCRNGPTVDNAKSEMTRLDELDDVLSTTTAVFLGLTVGCARCHDHKYDPISQADYYRLLAVFNNSAPRDYPVGPPEERALARGLLRQLEASRREAAALLAPAEYGSGEWRVVSGELAQERPGADARLYFGGPNWTDYTFEVEAQKVAGDGCLFLLFQAADRHNAFLFSAGGDRRPAVEREVDARRAAVGSAAAGPAEAGRWYRLRVEARGQHFRCSVDGQVVQEFRDDRHPCGRVGVGSAGAAARFRNIRVTDPHGRVLFAGLPELDGDDLRPPIQRPDRRPRIEPVLRQVAEVEGRLSGLTLVQGLAEQGPRARPTYLLLRGDPRTPGPEVRPGVPAVLARAPLAFPGPPPRARGSGRRLTLARWVASPDNPLTARVMVNRVWQYHFGTGLVETASDFGRRGSPPSHPELLDWLADEFVRSGWSVKHLHRLLMTSAAYRQSSGGAGGRLLACFPRRRLDAEEVRDAVLAASGNLNRQMFGPGVKPRLDPGARAGAPESWPEVAQEGPEHWRRSVYVFVKRSLPFPLLESFDLPASSGSCARRTPTTVAPQALLLLNDAFTNDQAEAMAARVLREAGPSPEAQAGRAFRLALVRPPTAAEQELSARFLLEQEGQHRAGGAPQPARAALADLCHVLFNLNEFVYAD